MSIPKIRHKKFETTIIDHYRRCEFSTDGDNMVQMYLWVVSTIMCEIILYHIFHKWQVGGNFTYGFRPPVDFHL